MMRSRFSRIVGRALKKSAGEGMVLKPVGVEMTLRARVGTGGDAGRSRRHQSLRPKG